ncbi:MAG: hypothetical protein QME63_06485 [Actinomycetota bacterium]|nr:hypothetical protein [Actinomycetota bacterium]
MATGNFYVQDRSQLKRYLKIIAFLGLFLLALLLIYNMMSRPPEIKGENTPKGLTNLFSIYGFEGDRLSKPSDVAVDSSGNIYIADTDKHRIVVCDSNGNFIETFGERGKRRYQLWYPNAIAVADNGMVFVVCKQTNKVVIFDSSHKPVWEINVPEPVAVTTKKNRLYVTASRGILIGDFKGNQIAAFGSRGKMPGQVDFPSGIAVDDKGIIYVADSMNYRVQAFTPEGKSLWTYGKGVKGDPLMDIQRTFGLPASITIDKDGLLYVMDAFAGEIYIMNNKGEVLDKVGDWGHNEGTFYYPAGIKYAGNETFVVADKFNDRVQVIRIPSPIVTPVERLTGYGVPVAALLALAALALWLLRRRTVKYILDESFLREALNKGHAASLITELGNVYTPDIIFERYKDVEDSGVKLGSILKTKPYPHEVANAMQTDQGCSEEEAAALALATETRGRILLLTESERVEKAAAEYNISTKGYSDIVDVEATETASESV